MNRLMGYVAKYDGVDVYMITEKDYFELKTPNPYIYYVIYRPKNEKWLVLQGDQIIGATDKSLDIEFWKKDENPNWKLAGMYSKLRVRQAAYMELNKREELEDIEGQFENPVENLEDVEFNEGEMQELGVVEF